MRETEHQVTLRRAQRRDANSIAAIRIAAWQTAYRGIMPDAYLDQMCLDSDVERMQTWVWDSASSPHLVCEVDGRVVGWVFLLAPARDKDLEPQTVELAACYVEPSFWGRRIGHQMVAEAVELARACGMRTMVLWVLEQNVRALHFYGGEGFELDGERRQVRHVPGIILPLVRMVRVL